MLVIRQEQMASLREAKLQQFADSASAGIRKNHKYAFQYYTDNQLRTWVVNQLHYLDRHQIDSENSVLKILDLLALFGEQFERCKDPSWGIDIIETPGNSADFKAALLEHYAEVQIQNNNVI